ncbi:MAG: RNA pyrophosphohydrolase [Gammaproteobacteria bacterium]|nr:RNA pyrophosphohydrolase [Gammaproteobacteria bacterium]
MVQTYPEDQTLDADGYRRNVGIVLSNPQGQVFWARRIRHDGWQFPQGGIQADETSEQAMFRELQEETGLSEMKVHVIGRTRDWLRYDLPERYQRSGCKQVFRGQKQRWYLLKLTADESAICLNASERPEFDQWCWVNYWFPLDEIVKFKREVYQHALLELAPLLFNGRPDRQG